MKRVTWTLAPLLSLACAGELRAQFPPYSYSGGGLGFSYQRRNLSLFGYFGAPPSGRMAVNAAFGLAPYPPPPYEFYGPPVLLPPRMRGLRPPPMPAIEDETAGIDLDLVPSAKSSAPEVVPAPRPVPAPAPAFEMPGKDVSKQVPPVRPDDVAPPKKAPEPPPPPPKPEPPPAPPAPPAGPKEESAHLANLGLTAFSAQAYGLATHRFRQAITADPKGARAHFLLAQAQFALGKYTAAVESIHAGMRLHNTWPTAPFQPRLDLYGGIEPDFAAQLKRLEGAVQQAPKQPALRFLLAYQLWFDNRRDEAVAQFRQARALTADPRFIDPFLAAAAPKQVVLK